MLRERKVTAYGDLEKRPGRHPEDVVGILKLRLSDDDDCQDRKSVV